METLEWRLLLATLATTLDVNNNPVIFAINQDTVQDNRQVPTNDSATPYRGNGFETLSGITPTSIAAYQAANGAPVVLATTGPQSVIYSDAYESTGNPAEPYAWTGWERISSFVAQSLIAVSASGSQGPAIFAIGADQNVYEDLYVGSASAGQFTGFQILPGLSATSLAAIDDSADSFRVFALDGPGTFVYQDTTTNSGNTIQSTGWAAVDTNFVASSISVASGPTAAVPGGTSPNTLMLFAIGAGDGQPFDDSLVLNTDTGERTGGGFQIVGNQPSVVPNVNFTASTATDSGDYLTVFALSTSGSVYENEYVLTGLADPTSYWLGWQPLYSPGNPESPDPFGGSAVDSISTAAGGVEVVTNSEYDYAVAPPHAALSSPGDTPIANVFSIGSSVLMTAYHPIVTTLGLTGFPVLFTIGSDGSVYESQDLTTSTGANKDPYSGYTLLAGLKATSLAATTESDGLALFALTAGSSQVFEDQYRPTGGDASTYEWTGWQSLGDFIATSIGAATGGDSATNGPTVFAIGTNGNVYEAGSTAPATPSGVYTFGTFSVLAGLAAPMISVRATDTGIEVAGLAGPDSDAYVDLDTAGVWSGWQVTGDYVMSSVLATTSATGGPAVAGTSPLGWQAVSTYDSTIGWGGYQPIFFLTAANGTDAILDGLTSVTLPDQAGVMYYDLIQPLLSDTSLVVYPAISLAGSTSTVGLSPFGYFGYSTIAAAPDTLLPTIYVAATSPDGSLNGAILVLQAEATNLPSQPYSYTMIQLGDIPS